MNDDCQWDDNENWELTECYWKYIEEFISSIGGIGGFSKKRKTSLINKKFKELEKYKQKAIITLLFKIKDKEIEEEKEIENYTIQLDDIKILKNVINKKNIVKIESIKIE